tara:strand:+ start:2918 stop:3820 length:903 start_codon:yes stop_codon:yes gene_type:complete
MASQQLKNRILMEIDSLYSRAKTQLKNEGKKKLQELKQELPTPQEVLEKLKAEINSDTCSEEGQEKFMKIYNNLNDKLTTLEDLVGTAVEALENIKNEVKPITEKKGPIGAIEEFLKNLDPIIKALTAALLILPLAYAANSGPTSSGAVQNEISKKEEMANSKVKEFAGLIASIPIVIQFYINQFKKLTRPIDQILGNLKFVQTEVIKLKMFIASLLTDFQGQCDMLANSQNPNPNPPPVIPEPSGPTPLDDYLNLLQTQYNDVYQQLIASGNEKAIERILHINENLENDYYLSHKIINL